MAAYQDALQRGAYMDAISGRPMPKVPFKFPSKEEMKVLLEKAKANSTISTGPISFPSILNCYLGYYFFKLYLKSDEVHYNSIHPLLCIEKIDLFKSIQLGEKVRAQSHSLLDYCKSPIDKHHVNTPKVSDADFVPEVMKFKVDAALFERSEVCHDEHNKCGVGESVLSELYNMITEAESHDHYLFNTFFDALSLTICKNLAAKHWHNFCHSDYLKLFLQYSAIAEKKLSHMDFWILRTLGKGGFGLVSACMREDTGKIYAMKTMNKHRVKKEEAEDLCLSERAILGIIDSPFVLSVKYAFQNNDELSLVLDIMTGGDMGFHLDNERRFSEERTKFYAAQILLGIEHLHSKNIMFRDLKPGNILFSQDGNCAITDLGLAVELPVKGYKISGVAGTRGYWAPEVLKSRRPVTPGPSTASLAPIIVEEEPKTPKKQRGSVVNFLFNAAPSIKRRQDSAISHFPSNADTSGIAFAQSHARSPFPSPASIPIVEVNTPPNTPPTSEAPPKRGEYGIECDWWSYGCLIYEMLYGKCPFRLPFAKAMVEGDEKKGMEKATLEWDPPYEFEKFTVNEEAKDLIKKLLIKDPENRIGTKEGANEIKKHAWFASIDWGLLEKKRISPPWKPESNLNAQSETKIGDFESVHEIMEEHEHAQFDGWEFTSKESAAKEIVEYLLWEERNPSAHLLQTQSGCCTIL